MSSGGTAAAQFPIRFKEAAVLCTWIVTITPNDVKGRSGFVPPAYMAIVNSKTKASAKFLGGWP